MDDVVDRALARLHQTDLEYATARVSGLASHGAMVVASLAEAGRIDRIEEVLSAYLPRLRPLPEPDGEAPRLGDGSTRRAWIARYEDRLLGAEDWRARARETIFDLLPGAVAGAAHGWLRTAHAVHLLAARDTQTRRRELAFGLASWASRFQRLPGDVTQRRRTGVGVLEALARVPIVPLRDRSTAVLVHERAMAVARWPGFAEAVESLDVDAAPVDLAVSELTDAAARLFLATPRARFTYLHAVTATSAIRLVRGVFDDDLQRRALAAVFQVVAAFHATHAEEDVREATVRAGSRERVLARLVFCDDEHDIKLAVAALREDRERPQPRVLAAAEIGLSDDRA